MAEVITRGDLTPTRIDVSEGVSIAVRAPGLHVTWRTLDAPPAAVLSEAVDTGQSDDWAEAIAVNELEPVASIAATAEAVDTAGGPLLALPGSPDAYVELHSPEVAPDEGVLLMAEVDGIVQWYLPSDPPHEVRAAISEAVESVSFRQLRFQVPASVVAGSSGGGVGESIGGAILHFFKFKIITELIGAGVDGIVKWIIDHVEARNKPEGFRRFDKAAAFPLLNAADLQALGGKRVLLLTHGIFSSLAGAFDGIADPANPVRQHLAAIYGDRIIGWDHWTVAKTPLDNARELLAALPTNIQPDIVCHSRGALVTRAMLEHPALQLSRQAKFAGVGKAIFIAGANQGSQLATPTNINRFLNIFNAVASLPILGAAGVVLKVLLGTLKVVAQIGLRVPSIQALSADPSNPFLQDLNGPLMTPTGKIVVAHANYDPSKGPLAKLLDLNVDAIFQTANDMVVPFVGAELFDKFQQVGTNLPFGTATKTQGDVMHLNFFFNDDVRKLLVSELA